MRQPRAIVMPAMGKGTRAASAAPMIPHSTSVRKLSRRTRKPNKRFMNQLNPYVIYRFQGLSWEPLES